MGLFIRLPEFPYDMVAGFPYNDPVECGRSLTFFYDLALEVTSIIFPMSYRLHRSASLNVGGGSTKCEYQEARFTRAILEAGFHRP